MPIIGAKQAVERNISANLHHDFSQNFLVLLYKFIAFLVTINMNENSSEGILGQTMGFTCELKKHNLISSFFIPQSWEFI